MFAIIPHHSTLHAISQAQKKALTQLCKNDCIWAPLFPLWIMFDDERPFFDFERAKNSFKKLTLLEARIDCDALFFAAQAVLKDEKIINGTMRVGINLQECGTTAKSAVHSQNLAKPRDGAHSHRAPSHTISLPDFPIRCSVFRIACVELHEDAQHIRTWCVQKSHWVKLP